MNKIAITTSEFEQSSGLEEIGKKVIKEIVPPVMQRQTDPKTVGNLIKMFMDRAYPKRIRIYLGYEDGRFYRVDKEGGKLSRFLYDVKVY